MDEPKKPTIDNISKKIEFQEFIEWIALPSKIRKPKTQKELANELGVDNATLSDWKKVEGFWDKVKELRKLWVQDKVSNILSGLYNKALKGDTSAAKMLLEYANEFTEVTEVKHKIERNLTPEEKEQLNKALEYVKGQNTKQQDIQDKPGEE